MKATHLNIHIAEPCHENWNKMHPNEKGKFCDSCQKSVYDFSEKTDSEIISILSLKKDEKVCGRFRNSQISKPIRYAINLNAIPKNMTITKSFAIAVMIVFGTLLFSCTDESGKKVDTIEINDKEKIDGVMGMMIGGVDFVSEEDISDSLEKIIEENYYIAGDISTDPWLYLDPENDFLEEGVACDSNIILSEDRSIMGGIGYYLLDSIDSTLTDTSKINSKIVQSTLELKNDFAFGVFPNPNSGIFHLKYQVLKPSNVVVTIYDLTGIIIQSVINQINQYEGQYIIPVSLNHLPNGIYVCKIQTNEKEESIKFVINN